jgi:diamine N-acetyltransferase
MQTNPVEPRAAEAALAARAVAAVSLRPVDADNWLACVALGVADDQRDFVMPVSYYLNLRQYGGTWHRVAVYSDREVAGFAMWAVDPEDRSGWIRGLTIDVRSRGHGLGRATVLAMLEMPRERRACSSTALGYTAENLRARGLYASLGFAETGETEDDRW